MLITSDGGGAGGGKGDQEFQHGGQFEVRGPSGADQVPVGFMATAGERVTVTPAGEQASGKTINIGPINVYSRDDEQAFLNTLIAAFRGI